MKNIVLFCLTVAIMQPNLYIVLQYEQKDGGFEHYKRIYIMNVIYKGIPYSGLFSRGKIFTNARCRVILRGKFSRMVHKELINNHTSIQFQGENIRELRPIREIRENFPP